LSLKAHKEEWRSILPNSTQIPNTFSGEKLAKRRTGQPTLTLYINISLGQLPNLSEKKGNKAKGQKYSHC